MKIYIPKIPKIFSPIFQLKSSIERETILMATIFIFKGISIKTLRVLPGVLLITVFLFIISNKSYASCDCSQGSNSIYMVGTEYIAQSCPSDPPSENTTYNYLIYGVDCKYNTHVTNWSFQGSMSLSPGSLSGFGVYQGYRVLRNTSGTHIYHVHPNFTGQISGVNFAGLAPGVYYADIDRYCCNLPNNTYSCSNSLPVDSDGDGFADCIDNCPDNSNPDQGPCPLPDSDGDGIPDKDDLDNQNTEDKDLGKKPKPCPVP